MRVVLCATLAAAAAFAQEFTASPLLDATIEEAIKEGQIPGAVLVVGHDGRIVHRKAYGNRALAPRLEAMTLDTVFDCASLTKVVATTASLMKLFDQGKFRLNDRVTQYLPAFENGKSDITIRNLLTHFSGLRPDLTLEPAWSGYQTGIKLAFADKPRGAPGTRFVYSDINFILLGELVHKFSGKLVSDYARENVFLPLGMKETMFQPPAALARAHRAHRTTRQERAAPPRRGARPDHALHGRRRRTRGNVFYRGRSLPLLRDDAAEGRVGRRAPLQPPRGGEVHHAAIAARSAHPARPRLGYRFAFLRQPRRPVPHRLLRPYRLHRHLAVDRPAQPHLRHPAHQRRAPAHSPGHYAAAGEGGHAGCAGVRIAAARDADRL